MRSCKMGWDMTVYAYRPRGHDARDPRDPEKNKICLRWDRQMPEPVGDWMLAWAVQEGIDAALARAEGFDGDFYSWNPGAWPEPYKTYAARRDLLWKVRHDRSDAICDLCKWFYDGPSSSSEMVVGVKDVHHSFGCSGDLMMSDWFVKNLWVGDEPTVDADAGAPEWLRRHGACDDEDEDEPASWPMFCETQRRCSVARWTSEGVRDARRRLADMGDPVKRCDVDALEETLDVLAWAERQLLADEGVEIVCVHDF